MTNDDSVRLWGRDFTRVRDGLDERQVRAFVDALLSRLNSDEPASDAGAHSATLDKLAQRTVVEAEKLADQLKEEARQVRIQAQVEAERLIAEAQAGAKEQGDAIARLATKASEEAQMIVQAARERGSNIEKESKRRANELVEIAKRQLESQIRRDVRSASQKLVGYVDDISKQVQALNVTFETWEAATVEEADLASEPSLKADEASASVPLQPPEPPVESVEGPPSAATAPPAPPDALSTPTPAPTPAQEPATTPSPRAVHAGPLQLVIRAPVNLAGLGEIYERLVQLEDVTLRDTRKSDDGSYVINLTLGNPTPLIDILSRLDNVAEAEAGPPPLRGADGDGSVLPAGAGGDATTRIVVRLK